MVYAECGSVPVNHQVHFPPFTTAPEDKAVVLFPSIGVVSGSMAVILRH